MRHDPSALRLLSQSFNRFPKLSREREHELAVRWKRDRDEEAAQELMNANLRYVAAIASKFRNYPVSPSDLVSEGSLALRHALNKFDPDRGLRFITYAAFWIRASMVRHVLGNWSVARSGGGPLRSKLFFKLRRERARAFARYGEGEQAMRALEVSLGMKADRIQDLLDQLDARDVSLDEPCGNDESLSLLDRFANQTSSHDVDILRGQDNEEMRHVVQEALEVLNARELLIVRSRMLAEPEDELSLAELGRRLGVSRERVRQLEGRAVQKLKVRIETSMGDRGRDLKVLLSAA